MGLTGHKKSFGPLNHGFNMAKGADKSHETYKCYPPSTAADSGPNQMGNNNNSTLVAICNQGVCLLLPSNLSHSDTLAFALG